MLTLLIVLGSVAYIGTATGRANMARQRVSDILTNMSG